MIWVYNYKHPDCLLFLKIGTTLAIFMLAGTTPEEREMLRMWTSGLAIFGIIFFTKILSISSCPVLFLSCRF